MANLVVDLRLRAPSISMMLAGEKAQAEQLLDELAALQRTDGSIDFAFNVADGSSLQQFRAGSIAWLGLAAATYGNLYRSTALQRPRRRCGALAAGPQAVQRPARRRPRRLLGLHPAQPDRLVLPELGRRQGRDRRQALGARQGGERDRRRHRARADRPRRRDSQRRSAGRQGPGPRARRADPRPARSSRPRNRGQSGKPTTRRQGPRLPRLGLRGQRPLDRASRATRSASTRPTRRPARSRATGLTPTWPDVLWAEGTAQVRFAAQGARREHLGARQVDERLGRRHEVRHARRRPRGHRRATSTSTTCGRPRPPPAGRCSGSVGTPSIAF